VRIQNARTKRTRKDSDDDEETDNDLFPQDVDLYQLQVNTLRRYKRHYKIATRPGMNKAQLADVNKHISDL
jgi:histone deacetylase complex subunit SAP30